MRNVDLGLAGEMAGWSTPFGALEKLGSSRWRHGPVLDVADDAVAAIAGLRAQLRTHGAPGPRTAAHQPGLRIDAGVEPIPVGRLPFFW